MGTTNNSKASQSTMGQDPLPRPGTIDSLLKRDVTAPPGNQMEE
jgi:hypothetical protein